MNAVNCPNCRDALEVPAELLGREVRCAACGTVFVAAGSAAPTIRPPAFRTNPIEPEPPSSNRGVWILLIFTGVVAGGITAGCAGLFTWSTNPKMTLVTAEDRRFKLEMPGNIKPVTRNAGMKGFESTRPMSQDRYFVTYYDLPADADLKDADAILSGEIQREITGVVPDPKAPPKPEPEPKPEQRITTHDGYPARDYWQEVAPLSMQDSTILRAILVGRRVYLLGVKGPGLRPEVWWVMRFFKSFEVAEGPGPAKP